MACNPNFDKPVQEKQIYQSNLRKVVEIRPADKK
jgi:hypothetical protein